MNNAEKIQYLQGIITEIEIVISGLRNDKEINTEAEGFDIVVDTRLGQHYGRLIGIKELVGTYGDKTHQLKTLEHTHDVPSDVQKWKEEVL